MLVEHDEQDAADHEDDDGGPDVGAQPQNHCGVVDAHVFDPGAAQSVPHQVHGELLASPKAVGELMAKVDDDRGADEVPDHLIQECGMEQGGFVVGALGDTAEDGHAAFPHLEDVDQVAGGREVVGRRGDAVVEACAHQSAGHGDERGVENLVEGAAVALPARGEDPHSHADANQDADCIHVNGKRADLEFREGRRGDIGQIHRASLTRIR